MNNLPPIRTQIAQCEVAYYKIQHTNPVLAEVDMEFYHSLPPVQVLLEEMTRLESLAMKLEANDNKTTTNTTNSMTTTRPKPKIHTETNTIRTTEYNNNINKTNDNCTKADDDKHIAEQAREMKRQHKQARERKQAWQQNNNKRMSIEANNRETEKEQEKETARRRCEIAQLELARQLPKKQQQTAIIRTLGNTTATSTTTATTKRTGSRTNKTTTGTTTTRTTAARSGEAVDVA